MKKFAVLLIALVMLLTACGQTVEEISENVESTPSEENMGPTVNKIVSVGKSYTLKQTPNEHYPDFFGQQLTDGVRATDFGVHYTDPRTVGFAGNVTAVIDLGDVYKVTDVIARVIDMNSDGVGIADSVIVQGSVDGKKYSLIGRSRFVSTGLNTMSTCKLSAEEPTEFRYIKVYITRSAGFHFVFLDEIEVYADVPTGDVVPAYELAYQSESIDRTAWKALSTGVEANPKYSNNVIAECGYSFENCVFDERAPKNDEFLTDGERTSRHFGENVFVGINSDGSTAPSVTVKTPMLYNNIYAFKVYALGAGADLELPAYIDVYGSEDGKAYTFVGRMYAPAATEHYTYTLILSEYISARYYKFEFPTIQANYWIEEIEICEGLDEKPDNGLYPDLCFPTVTEDIYWDSSEEDYSEVQNLLIGADQQIAAMYCDDLSLFPDTDKKFSPYDFKGLADGKYAKSYECYSGEYFFSVSTLGAQGYSNCLDFFYDLGHISTIKSLCVNLLERPDYGIKRPRFITVFLSEDGDTWYNVGEYTMKKGEIGTTAQHLKFDFPLETEYAARFVRFRVEQNQGPFFIFIDELEAFGTKKVSEKTARISDSGLDPVIYYTNKEREQYVTLETSSVNSQDQVLIMPDYGDENTLLPMLAYLDENGNITDTMFDGVIYWTLKSFDSGIQSYQPSKKSDWLDIFQKTFTGVNGLDRVNEVAGQVKEALGLTDYTVKVYVSTLTLREEVTDFGDVDGDGISENLSIEADRKKVAEWYVDLVMREFNNRGYEHIVLDGFNYVDESIGFETDNSYTVREIGDAVKAAGSNYIWIPYYVASRFYLGSELNFDAVCMQMNYVFDSDAPEYRIHSSAEMTKRLQFGIEMEHTRQCFGDRLYARQYMKYLEYGMVYGYHEGIHMYYQDYENYTRMCYSGDPLCRMQYDATYEYIKGTLDVTPDVREKLSFSTAKDSILCETLNPEATVTELYVLSSAPEHGSVSITDDGRFIYFPDKGYTGTDSFSYTYSEFLSQSEPCTVEITVG